MAALGALGATLLSLTVMVGVAGASPTHGTSGDPSQPQPQSTADANRGGANGQCPSGTYCSTRHGEASHNGSGTGKASGKPCAGCVGKADNKNPPGQEKSSPRTTFPNNGYECDNNNGIGKTNPAHTGCTTPTTSNTPGSDCTTNPPAAGCTQGGGASCTTGCTQGGTTCTTGCTTAPGSTAVLGEKLTKLTPTSVLRERVPSGPTAAVAARHISRTPSALPLTGAPIRVAFALGAAAALSGLVLLVAPGLVRRQVSPSRARASDS